MHDTIGTDADARSSAMLMIEQGPTEWTVRQIFAGAAAEGVRSRYELIPAEDLFTADGVWLASSIRGVCPVVRLDGRDLAVDAAWSARVAAWGGF